MIKKSLHIIHRSIYLFTAFFSRSGIDKFLREQIYEINSSPDNYKNILNVGSGGFVSRSIAHINSGATVLNVDIDPKRNPDVVADICSMVDFEDECYDAVFMVEVLEHVKSPQKALQEVHRILRKGGILILTTPFLFEIHDRPYDYYRFTKYGLELLLEDYASVQIQARNRYLDAIIVLIMRLFVSHHIQDKAIAILLMLAVITLYPLIWVINRIIISDAATTGYLTKCIK